MREYWRSYYLCEIWDEKRLEGDDNPVYTARGGGILLLLVTPQRAHIAVSFVVDGRIELIKG
jgi:hypothetical protein